MDAYRKMQEKIYVNKIYMDGKNDWVVVDVGSSGFVMAVDGDSVWEDSIEFSIDSPDTITYQKDSGGLKHRAHNIKMQDYEIKMCERIKKALLK